jgi:subtilase family serine protease
LISLKLLDNDNFSGWTEWVVGDSITLELENEGGSADLMISKYEYLTADDTIDIINSTLQTTNTTNFTTVIWNASTAGERNIVAIIDDGNSIPELNENNNSKTTFLRVHGADLTISDLQLTVNGSEINDTIANGTIVNINATITNIGVKATAKNFNVTLVCDDIHGERMEITNVTIPYLNPDNSEYVNTTWNATIGDYTITAIADPENRIFETSNSNNTLSKSVVVLGADMSITGITFRVLPPDDADINDASSPVYDTDMVVINATIENQGLVQADNFSAYIFYEYEYLGNEYREPSWVGDKNDKWMNKGYGGAECICIHITNLSNINGRLIVYDGTGTEIARPDKSCWIPVVGDTANIKYPNVHGLGFTVDWYAGNITKLENLSLVPGKSINISMRQPVGTGEHSVRVLADPENTVPGDPDQNNCANLTLYVLPSRDFIPEIYLTHNGSGIEANDTVWDGDTVTVDVDIRMDINESDPYNEYRKGTVDVDVIDEHEWIDASPRFELTSDGYAQVIRYPGADAIRVHFKELDVSGGIVEIRDRNGTVLCTLSSYTPTSPWLDRDEIYLYKASIYKYSTYEIDKYQYRKINRTTVEVAANETAYISARFTPSAGYHTIYVITDPADKIGEIIESNNEANETIYVEPCRDPAVVDIMFSNELPDPGTAVNITANVTNNGNITATFTVDLYAMKYEYRPCASRHPPEHPIESDYYNVVFEKEINTYPEANWTGVHFTKISTTDNGMGRTYLYVSDRYGKMSEDHYGRYEVKDLWTWVSGDVLKIKTKLFCNYWASVWGFDIDTVAHTVTLNQTTVILKAGETASVTGTLPNVRIGNRSISYTITAVVDQDNIVFETNELNNVVSRELVANCPDLKVDFNPPDEAVIRNIGTKAAEGVEVRLWHDVSYSQRKWWTGMEFPPDNEMPDDEPDAVRVHFKKLTFDKGEVWIRNETGDIIHTIYPGNYPDTWVEVEGKVCGIYYNSTDVEDIEIDRYEYAYDKKVGNIPMGDRKKTKIPWTEYEAPYNLTIDADPGNYVIESDEDNNNKTISIHADIVPEWIYFSKPTEDKLIEDLKSTIEVTIMNDGTAPTGEFNITLEVKDANGTIVFDQIRHTSLSAMQSDKIEFLWTPSDSGYYTVSAIADSDGNVMELYENNNVRSRDIFVYPFSGYSGGGSLVNYKHDLVHGDVIFTIGDSRRLQSVSKDDTLRVTFDDAIPAKVKLARLYLYVDTGSDPSRKIALPIEVDMKFNDHMVQTDREYTDISIASHWNVTYGLYCYDITPYVDIEKENVAVATKISPQFGDYYYFGIAAIGLLVVTEDDDAILTKYWINEGIDTVMAMNGNFETGLPFEDCTVLAEFDDVEHEDLDSVNATLMSILSLVGNNKEFLYPAANGEGDVLRFNEHQIGAFKEGSHWVYQSPEDSDSIAMTYNKWEYVTDNLQVGSNLATIQSKGNFIVPSNAFLVLRYPPDLAVTDIEAPVSAVVGNKYVINTTISNEGRGNATDFNVSFYSNRVRVGRQKISRLDSGDNITLQFNWKPMYMGKIYKLKVAADVVSGPNWIELDVDNNVMTKNVPIVEGGFGNESGPMGEGGAGAGGSGDGEGLSLFDVITGILMKGTVLKDGSGGGGGGIGEFSMLEWLMKGLILTSCSLLVYFGYSMEKRRYNKR